MIYTVAERFKSLQGEGVYAGTPMGFIRFVGCSVGKKVCQHCDTDFDNAMPWRGGGNYEAWELTEWGMPYQHICLTGGEPLDQDLQPLFNTWDSYSHPPQVHIETSGTVIPEWIRQTKRPAWVCVSPKPGWKDEMIEYADEIKVIVPGLGTNPTSGRWPTLEDAARWAAMGKVVFLQPRNAKFDVDKQNLLYVTDLLRDNPQFRLSVQMHKLLKVQ